MNFEEMDNISMVIMFTLSEYLSKIDISLQDFLGEKIQKQAIKNKSEEIITTADFFEILEEIGMAVEENQHENLQEFLCVDSTHKNKLAISKIKTTLDEFNKNKKLKEKAFEYYKELAKDLQDEGDEMNLDDIEMKPNFQDNIGGEKHHDKYMEQFVRFNITIGTGFLKLSRL